MTTAEITRIQDALTAHVAVFRTEAGLPCPMEIKLAHSLRVAANCRDIAAELGWDAEETAIGEIVGLLHDIGRFEQYDRFRTFSDPQSLDHAALACEIIERDGLLGNWPAEDRSRVLDAVRYHNRKALPAGLPETVLSLARLIRDADKIDIMKVIGDSLRNGDFSQHPEVLLRLDPVAGPTPAVVHEVRTCGTASYGAIRSIADLKLVGFAWVHDINYRPALRMIRERRMLDGFAGTLPKTDEIVQIIDNAENYLTRRLDQVSAPER